MKFLSQLRQRNPILYWFGWLNIAGAVICLILTQTTHVEVLGINAWIKPMKFYISIAVFCWTMGWYMKELQRPKAVKAFSIMAVIVFVFEMVVISWQAANGRLSHFNITTPLYSILFSLMGVAITVLAVWTLVIGIFFFRKKEFDAPLTYIWGIRLGILFFAIFSFEGGLMAAQLSHTIGSKDGSPGLPIVNWSRAYGDLRIAHFFGMHALQILPIFGFYIARTKGQVIGFAVLYFVAVALLFIQALSGIPFVRY